MLLQNAFCLERNYFDYSAVGTAAHLITDWNVKHCNIVKLAYRDACTSQKRPSTRFHELLIKWKMHWYFSLVVVAVVAVAAVVVSKFYAIEMIIFMAALTFIWLHVRKPLDDRKITKKKMGGKGAKFTVCTRNARKIDVNKINWILYCLEHCLSK